MAKLAALAPINGRMNLVMVDLETRKPTAVTGIKAQDVSGFLWANNERFLFLWTRMAANPLVFCREQTALMRTGRAAGSTDRSSKSVIRFTVWMS
jgi:hypothetical protein